MRDEQAIHDQLRALDALELEAGDPEEGPWEIRENNAALEAARLALEWALDEPGSRPLHAPELIVRERPIPDEVRHADHLAYVANDWLEEYDSQTVHEAERLGGADPDPCTECGRCSLCDKADDTFAAELKTATSEYLEHRGNGFDVIMGVTSGR